MNASFKAKGQNARQRILECIIKNLEEKGYAPSIRELGEMVGLKSPSSIHKHLLKMNNEGMIVYETDKQRAISVPGYKFVKVVD